MNTLEHIRNLMKVERTPEDKGWTLVIKLTRYDNEVLNVNGSPIGGNLSIAHRWLAAARIAVSIITEFEMFCTKRSDDSKAA